MLETGLVHPDKLRNLQSNYHAFCDTMSQQYRPNNVRGFWVFGHWQRVITLCRELHGQGFSKFTKSLSDHSMQWKDGYRGQYVIIINDVRKLTPEMVILLLSCSDVSPCRASVKRTMTMLNHRFLIITSHYAIDNSINQTSLDTETIQALRCRFHPVYVPAAEEIVNKRQGRSPLKIYVPKKIYLSLI